jgi:hypothetical protein
MNILWITSPYEQEKYRQILTKICKEENGGRVKSRKWQEGEEQKMDIAKIF